MMHAKYRISTDGKLMQIQTVILSLAALFVLSLGPVTAQEKSTLNLLTGETLEGTIEKIDPQGMVSGKGFQNVRISELLSVARPIEEKKPTIKYIIRLAGGGQIHAQEALIEDGIVKAETHFGDADLPVGSVRAIMYKPFELADVVTNAVKNPSKSNDRLVLEGKDGGDPSSVPGLVEEINDQRVSFDYKGQSGTIIRSRVIAVVMADLQEKQAAGTLATIKLKDTSVVVGAISGLENGTLSVGLLGNAKLKIPFDHVSGINIRSDRLVFLSDLEPSDTEYQTIVTPKSELAKDQSLEGNKLTLYWPSTKKTQTYDRGIALHSYSRIVFKNDGFQRFSAVCGIDAETGGNGDCKVQIRGDGIELWSHRISAKTDPQLINVEIDGYSEIELIVDHGKHLDMADHVDFANARFLKTK